MKISHKDKNASYGTAETIGGVDHAKKIHIALSEQK